VGGPIYIPRSNIMQEPREDKHTHKGRKGGRKGGKK